MSSFIFFIFILGHIRKILQHFILLEQGLMNKCTTCLKLHQKQQNGKIQIIKKIKIIFF